MYTVQFGELDSIAHKHRHTHKHTQTHSKIFQFKNNTKKKHIQSTYGGGGDGGDGIRSFIEPLE